MSVQPTGTVTLLFTDIEGSTQLLSALGPDAYAEALELHRDVLRDAFEQHEGYEVDTEGDAFFVAFASADQAVAAAMEAQQRLAAVEWPGGSEVRVRMGVHTGEPRVVPPKYVGIDVHRAARIMATGHGGQVLISRATHELVGNRIEVLDLGEHRLKDISEPQALFQCVIDGLPREFPPLRTVYRSNLPQPATPFVGRAAEVEEVTARLASPGTRVLTLVGPGGVGKTRLAVQAAEASAGVFRDGITWVPLAGIRDASLVAGAIGHALELPEQANVPPLETVRRHLAGQRQLIVLDNLEHLLPAVAEDVAALRDIGSVVTLTTSRERLQLSGEDAWHVPAMAGDEAADLFTDRARSAGAAGFGDSEAVEELCVRLDNLPLALELAAARTPVFSPEQLLDRLSERLDLLKGARDADPRHATLRATIEWSYGLLGPDEQQLLRRLSVFASGCTWDGAEAVCEATPDTLQDLVEKSLIVRWDGLAGPRYSPLETIREFAAEALERAGEARDIRRRHAQFYAALAEVAAPALRGGGNQARWFDRLLDELDNLREAVRFALAEQSDLAARIAGSLGFFFWNRGFLVEGRAMLDAALAVPTDNDLARARALEAAATVAGQLSDPDSEGRYAEEALALFTRLDDTVGRAWALREVAKAAHLRHEYDAARALYLELLATAKGVSDDECAVALNNLGDIALRQESWEEAVRSCSESREIRLRLGNGWGAALALVNVAFAEVRLGLLDDAKRDLRQALQEAVDVGSTMVLAAGLQICAATAMFEHRAPEAARLAGASYAFLEELGTSFYGAEGKLGEEIADSLESMLGADAYATELAAGRALGRDEAFALGLRVTA